ncbi:helix-turn-helix domain-containing protein [Belnapia moabensis]|uniref:hypothetical protein n=1 Tax=Belnapia moabensis TaxID=365533 RepID=UPI0012EE0201|nr:hypothetical protein [Belnapia moabensis]
MSDDLPPHRGAVLRDGGLVSYGRAVARAVGKHGVAHPALYHCRAGTAGVTPAMAAQLGRCTGPGGARWLILPRGRSLAEAEHAVGAVRTTCRTEGENERGCQGAGHGVPTGAEGSLTRQSQTQPSSRRAPPPTPR